MKLQYNKCFMAQNVVNKVHSRIDSALTQLVCRYQQQLLLSSMINVINVTTCLLIIKCHSVYPEILRVSVFPQPPAYLEALQLSVSLSPLGNWYNHVSLLYPGTSITWVSTQLGALSSPEMHHSQCIWTPVLDTYRVRDRLF